MVVLFCAIRSIARSAIGLRNSTGRRKANQDDLKSSNIAPRRQKIPCAILEALNHLFNADSRASLRRIPLFAAIEERENVNTVPSPIVTQISTDQLLIEAV